MLIKNAEGNVQWSSDAVERLDDIDEIILADLKKEKEEQLDPNVQRGNRSTLFPDTPPPDPDIDTAEPMIKLEPNLYPQFQSLNPDIDTAEPMIKLEPNLGPQSQSHNPDIDTAEPMIKLEPKVPKTNKSLRLPNLKPKQNKKLFEEIKIERPILAKDDHEEKRNLDSKKGNLYNPWGTHICKVCKMVFDHQIKLTAHKNLTHSKVKVDKDKLYECPCPGCEYK